MFRRPRPARPAGHLTDADGPDTVTIVIPPPDAHPQPRHVPILPPGTEPIYVCDRDLCCVLVLTERHPDA